MVAVGSREVIRMLLDAGWALDRVTGSHHMFKHPEHPEWGTVPVPHPKKDLGLGLLRSIEKQSRLKLR